MALTVHTLTDGWSFKQGDDDSENAWLSVKRVPTNVHLDLIEHSKYVVTWYRHRLRVLGVTAMTLADRRPHIEYQTLSWGSMSSKQSG